MRLFCDQYACPESNSGRKWPKKVISSLNDPYETASISRTTAHVLDRLLSGWVVYVFMYMLVDKRDGNTLQ